MRKPMVPSFEQKARGTGFLPQGAGRPGLFPHAEGHRHAQVAAYGVHHPGQPLRRHRIFARLQHNGVRARGHGFGCGLHYFVFGKRIAHELPVGRPQAAVAAIATADVGELHKPAHENMRAFFPCRYPRGAAPQFGIGRCKQELENVLAAHRRILVHAQQ